MADTTSRSPYRRGASALAVSLVLGTIAASCSSSETASGCTPRAIAWLGAITGPARRPPLQNGAELAVQLHNKAHPDCPVGYLFFDTQGDPEIAERLATSIIDDPQILAVVGPAFSGETKAVMPYFEKAGLPVVTASATNPSLADQGWTTFHRVVGNDSAQGPAAAAFIAQTLKAKRVAIIDDGGLYGKTLADLVAKSLGERGIVVAPRAEVDPDGLDYRGTVEAIADIGVDAIYFGGITDPAVRLLRQLRDASVSAAFMGGDGIFDTSLITGVGKGAEGAYITCPCLDPRLSDTPARTAFLTEYLAYFGEPSVGFAMEYFDAANILLAGLDSGASTRAAMKEWVSNIDTEGLTKRLSFDERGEIVVGQISVLQVQEARFRQVALVTDGTVRSALAPG
jgi:branched-chain amino acid transport system substrate-binding protein